MSWSAAQYTLFERQRTRPVHDLLAAVPTAAVRTAIDLGCGPGNSTQALAARFPDAAVTGLDSSADMVAEARRRLPASRIELADVSRWDGPGPFDVILSNAVLQWVPGHEALLPRLAGRLAPGGSLAIQMPDNLDEPAHVLMRAVAADGPWRAALAGAAGARGARREASWYYRLLSPHCSSVDVWTTTYMHVLAGGADAVVEWFKGSGLRPFLAPLDAGGQADFLARYRSRIAQAYPVQPDGVVLLPFPRLFIVATR